MKVRMERSIFQWWWICKIRPQPNTIFLLVFLFIFCYYCFLFHFLSTVIAIRLLEFHFPFLFWLINLKKRKKNLYVKIKKFSYLFLGFVFRYFRFSGRVSKGSQSMISSLSFQCKRAYDLSYAPAFKIHTF